ncbi:DUF1501 domain-containing protein [Myxococcota bacterium]|nr:DUF1501 domain-containing protein [Myxococcota bacterium]MBU1433225.1 DUF1501 domain-containing protein [Myxococcota bacterium]MBU1900635.1 DUF1501 domain-containing protein [Myxococcota bacterium]
MTRRSFLQLTGAAGLSLWLPPPRAHAAEISELFWVFVHASGGWDPTMLCDPKGRADEAEEDPVNHYFTDDIGEAGAIRYAPVGFNRTFFNRHKDRLLVINGLDTQTNGHDGGVRHMWSGKLSEGHPALAALLSARYGAHKPLSFLSNGGYEFTDQLIAPTRVGDVAKIRAIAYPNQIGDDPEETFHRPSAADRIQAAVEARRAHLEARFNLPQNQATISQHYAARLGRGEIKRLLEFLPSEHEDAALKRQAQVAVAAARAGVSYCANLSLGGFDTHSDHDNRQGAQLTALLEGVDFLIQEAERQRVLDRMVVVVGSDFGRTASYNDGRGKDHWSISSALLMGPGIRGGRVVGATDARLNAQPLDPTHLTPLETGVRLTPAHLHLALRQMAGLTDADTARYPLDAATLPLL